MDEIAVTAEFARQYVAPMVRGQDLTRAQAREGLELILDGQIEAPTISSFLTALTMKGETVDEMTGFVDAMMSRSVVAEAPAACVDVVGTGGDQMHSVNVSSMAAFAVAGAGVPVAKHGNRSATSSVGSADVLEALGIRLAVDAGTVAQSIDASGFGFYYAPAYHPSLGGLAPIRRGLGFRTIFNVLGPLANPARVRRGLIGVSDKKLLTPMADVLRIRGVDQIFLVRGEDGLDELSLSGPSSLRIVSGDRVIESVMDAPQELGVRHDPALMRGGDLAFNVNVFRRFLDGERGPVFDVVCANAGLALMAAGRVSELREGFALASEAVMSGRAALVLERAVEATNA
jgi:hypothetical protein